MLTFFSPAPWPAPPAGRLPPRSAATGTLFTHFYVDDPADTIREWFVRTLQAADVAELSLEAHYDRQPERVYLLGISNRSEEHTSELQSLAYLVCRLLLEKKKK